MAGSRSKKSGGQYDDPNAPDAQDGRDQEYKGKKLRRISEETDGPVKMTPRMLSNALGGLSRKAAEILKKKGREDD
jgi:hypothetical protein